ncbi:MAG: nprA [Bacteroidetes bacterium]|jgi:serine phosphatase RsbU (regulator of sigma subunit)|nr:nprA [Bacteroidota bacterium]
MLKKIFLGSLLFLPLTFFSQNVTDSIEYFLRQPDDTVKVEALLRLARPLESGDLPRAISVLTSTLVSSRNIHYPKGEVDALIGLAIVNNYRNRSVTADSFLQAALPVAIANKNRGAEGNIYNNLGMSYFNKFDYQKSLEYYFKALTIFDEDKKETKYSSTLNNIANLYFTIKDLDKALGFHEKSLAISRRLNEKSKVASSLYNIGLIHMHRKDALKALACFQESLQLAKDINHKVGQAMLYNSIGKCYGMLKDYPKALESSNHALELKKEIGDMTGIAILHNDIGDIYFNMRQYEKAIEYSTLSLEEAKKLKSTGLKSSAYLSLATDYSALKKYEPAYKNYLLYTECKDSIFNKEKSQQLADMGTKYETEKKDKELIRKDAEIKFQEAEANQKEMQRNAFIIGFALVALLAIIVIKSLRDKQKANKKLTLAYEEIDYKNKLVEEKNKSITDSIHYAKRIQSALLASDTLLQKNLPSYFVYYKPKDIVSGDFYWAHQFENKKEFLILTGDCTGHGVPGAFMSLLGVSSLNEIVIEKNISNPAVILDSLRNKLVRVLNPEGSEQQSYEGMDCALCKFSFSSMQLEISAANNSVWQVSGNKRFKEYKADKQPVGFHPDPKPFSLKMVNLQPDDTIYTFTDGFADQFGGPNGKKFKKKQLQELLISISHLPANEQKEELSRVLDNWKGKLEQIDDILIIGIKIPKA